MTRDGWKVGELAGATGLTVRTLHHWDEIGLLRPSRRTPSGHRLYNGRDVARLQQVTSLRELGFPLEEIRALLDERGISPREVVALHLARLREQIHAQATLAERLERIAAQLDRAETVSADELIQTIEATTMFENYFTPEQREELKARAATIGQDQIRAVEGEWETLMAEVRAEMDRGTATSDPRAQALAARWMELVRGFTGGNPEILGSLNRMWQQEPAIHGRDTGAVREMMDWIRRVQEAGKARARSPGPEPERRSPRREIPARAACNRPRRAGDFIIGQLFERHLQVRPVTMSNQPAPASCQSILTAVLGRSPSPGGRGSRRRGPGTGRRGRARRPGPRWSRGGRS